MLRKTGLAFALVVAQLVAGCAVTLRPGRPPRGSSHGFTIDEARVARCARSASGHGRPYREQLPGRVTDATLAGYLTPLPADVRRTAVAAGVEPLIARLLEARARSHGTPSLDALALRQELAERVASLETQLLATEFECECVIALIDRTLREHDDAEHARELALTIASLASGAGFSLAAGTWDLANARATDPAAPDGPIVTALVGAVVTTVLGVAVMVPRPREIVFVHERNLLTPVWRGADPELLYPTFVFRMLTAPRASGAPTPREELLATWQGILHDVPTPRRATATVMLSGSGGIYDADLLTVNRRLFEELESTLDSLSRDVDRLGRTLATGLDGELGAAPSPGGQRGRAERRRGPRWRAGGCRDCPTATSRTGG
ncbi:MAG: hypothetical protein EPO40_12890 [Myxococcaceae bacterium]|nr:MAG: hypothetical protein EPO40_12890 [Myxococcaceae bacterium]